MYVCWYLVPIKMWETNELNDCVTRDLHNFYTVEIKLIHIINVTCLNIKDFALLAERQILPYKYM